MPPAAVAVGATLVGTGISVAAQLEAAEAEANQASRAAEARRIQAAEILRRGEVNVMRARREAEKLSGAQLTAFAATGFSIGVSELRFMEETATLAREYINEIRLDAEKRAEQSLFEAVSFEGAAEDALTGGLFGALSTGVSGFGSMITAMGGTKFFNSWKQ